MVELTADDTSIDDRRHVVNAGLRRDRDAEIANLRARAETGMETITSAVIAVRGDASALDPLASGNTTSGPKYFHTVALCIIEIDTDERIVTRVGFDLEDFDAAIAQLESRYITGEAAACGRTWSAISGSYAAINRHELPLTTPDCVNVDRREKIVMGFGDLHRTDRRRAAPRQSTCPLRSSSGAPIEN